MRKFALLALLSLAAGCTSVQDPFLTAATGKSASGPIATEVAPEFAVAFLPATAGGIQTVRQTLLEKRLTQGIVYENTTTLSGENRLTVDIAKRGEWNLRQAPTERDIKLELRKEFPALRMNIATTIGDNAHGVFGYASAALPEGGSCIYAWQFARNLTYQDGKSFATALDTPYAGQVRLRYCHASMTEAGLATLMQGLRIKPMSASTFEMLGFAAGSASLAAPAIAAVVPPAPQSAVVQAKADREPAADEIAVEQPVQKARFRNATHVPLPGETVAVSDETPMPGRQDQKRRIKKGTAVPLPTTISSAALKSS
jgi:Cellulose biosynthesis protein BcsN